MHNEYDALGQRVATVENGIWHGFTVDRVSVTAETDAADNLITRYIRVIRLAA